MVYLEGTVTRRLGPYAVAIVAGSPWILRDEGGTFQPGTVVQMTIVPGATPVYSDGEMSLIEGMGLLNTRDLPPLPRAVAIAIAAAPTEMQEGMTYDCGPERDFGESHRSHTTARRETVIRIPSCLLTDNDEDE